jgi:hypothetical protein
MLENLDRRSTTEDAYRFANLTYVPRFAERKGLTVDQIAEIIAFDRDDVTLELLEGPFTRIPALADRFGSPSRFSNGDWPVFYTALSRETAEKETSHHYGRKAAGDAEARRAVYYSIVSCAFAGDVTDLRPKLVDWPDLVSDDYAFCLGLGKEANESKLDGFLAPSARHPQGTTLPVFMPGAVSNPKIEATAKLSFPTDQAVVEIEELP